MENMRILQSTMFKDVIASLVYYADWGLISIVKEEDCVDIAPLNQIKVLSYKDKGLWQLEQKYNIGKKGKTTESE